ncbi:MAG TPA: hypothetical protein VGB78_05170 [Thermoplasmata archaeon]
MLEYLAALMMIGHGIGHIVGVLAAWTSVNPGFVDKPWILSGDHRVKDRVGVAWGFIWLAAIAPFLLSGIAILLGDTWWRETALIGAAASIVAIVPWWNTVVVGARAGVALDLAIILVLLLPWGEEVTDFFGLP